MVGRCLKRNNFGGALVAQALGKARKVAKGNRAGHRPPDSALVDDVNVIASDFDLGRFIDEYGRASKHVHFSSALSFSEAPLNEQDLAYVNGRKADISALFNSLLKTGNASIPCAVSVAAAEVAPAAAAPFLRA